ncbi:peroxiredoxin [Aureococcus anophagefferens]|nr:peroxiredoxin [Aureococcus anophagefferens]
MAASKSRKELRQDWADQPADGVSTTQELYLRETEDSDDDDDDRDYLAMQIGDDLPDFTAESTHGEIKFYEATENQWTLFVSFSRNYDPVATSELAQLAKMLPEFDERKAQYPDTTGRNFDEIIRAVDALQLRHANPTVACGVNWMVGEDVFITNDVPKAKAKQLFPRGFVEIRPWFRLAPPPEAGS